MENTVPSSATERPRLVTSWPASKHVVRRGLPRCTDEFVFIKRPSAQHFQRRRVVAYKVMCWCLVLFLCDIFCACVRMSSTCVPFVFQGPLTWHPIINIGAVVLDASILSLRVSRKRDMTAYFTCHITLTKLPNTNCGHLDINITYLKRLNLCLLSKTKVKVRT